MAHGDTRQPDLFDASAREADNQSRALIDQLIAATRLYDDREKLADLLQFTARLRVFAPFNAMLLHIQKPGLTHAATAKDWYNRFGRVPKTGARPLLVLRMKGPVDFVFDILDTEGRPVPENAFTFPTLGNLSEKRLEELLKTLSSEGFTLEPQELGDGWAGWIKRTWRWSAAQGRHRYTLAHELAHMFLGHLGADPGRNVPDRSNRDHALREIEAESTAYLLAKRNGLTPKSESYLSAFEGSFANLDIYSVMRAANAIEKVLGISAQTYWNEAKPA